MTNDSRCMQHKSKPATSSKGNKKQVEQITTLVQMNKKYITKLYGYQNPIQQTRSNDVG